MIKYARGGAVQHRTLSELGSVFKKSAKFKTFKCRLLCYARLERYNEAIFKISK